MSPATVSESRKPAGIKPFVLKWSEITPEGHWGSLRSVFSPQVNGLDIFQVLESDKAETTGDGDTADCTHSGA